MRRLISRALALSGRLVAAAADVLLRARYLKGALVLRNGLGSWAVEPAQAGYCYALQGHRVVSTGHQPDFCTDSLSGIRICPLLPSKLVRHRGLKGFDIKHIWDLGRFQFFSEHLSGNLGRAQQYELLMGMVARFRQGNRPYFGPNWMCTMDVAIRAVNVLYFFEGFRNSGMTSPNDERLIADFLYTHFRFISRNLENHSKVNGNHYLSNLCGLIVIGSRLDMGDKDMRIVEFALREFRSEVEKQFLPDGAYFENSTGYHRLSTEMLVYTLRFVLSSSDGFIAFARGCWRLNSGENAGLPGWVQSYLLPLLSKALMFCRHTTVPDGTFVQIGDNDSGRFINRDYLCHRTFESVYGHDGIGRSYFTLMRDIENLFEEVRYTEEVSEGDYLPGEGAEAGKHLVRAAEYRFQVASEETVMTVRCFPHFGLITWSASNFFMSLRCGHSDPKTSHAHEDQLSLTLWDNGRWVVADKGTATYNRNRETREAYRAVEAHFAPCFHSFRQGQAKGVFEFSYNGSYDFGVGVRGDAWSRWTVGGRELLRTVSWEDREVVVQDFVRVADKESYRHASLESLNRLAFSPEYGVM